MSQPPTVLAPDPVLPRSVEPHDVSVVVCCYTEDRWLDLVTAIDSVTVQGPRELIVVVDHNADLLARVVAGVPGVRALASTGPRGLSGARNTGLAAASGHVVAFLDDDAVAEPGWLAALAGGYDDADVIAVGGTVTARWPGERPAWFPAEFDWVVGCSWTGLPSTAGAVRNLIGANMSMRRSVLVEAGGFSTSLGRVGSVPLGCEETELCIRAQALNDRHVVRYDPQVAVRHRVTTARATWSYFWRRCLAEGLSKAQVARLAGPGQALASERSYVRSVLPRAVVRGLRDALRGDVSGLLRAMAVVAGLLMTAAGFARGSVRR